MTCLDAWQRVLSNSLIVECVFERKERENIYSSVMCVKIDKEKEKDYSSSEPILCKGRSRSLALLN